MSGREAPVEYYRTIEEEFVRRRGAALLLSPRDWTLIGRWHEAGIPLRIVLQGLANVFDAFERRAPAGRRINSLSYCRQEVLSLFDLHRSLRGAEAGRPTPGTSAAERARIVARHLGRLLRDARLAMALASERHHDPLVAALATAASDLRRLRKEAKVGAFDPQRLDSELRRLEDAVLDAALRSLQEDEVRRARDDADRALAAARARMTPEAIATTRRAFLARLLRRRFRLPRLTLFDDTP